MGDQNTGYMKLGSASRGGRTDLADGVLLCGHHHRLIHDDSYLHSRLPTREPRRHRASRCG